MNASHHFAHYLTPQKCLIGDDRGPAKKEISNREKDLEENEGGEKRVGGLL
jgi:hypothetical protein